MSAGAVAVMLVVATATVVVAVVVLSRQQRAAAARMAEEQRAAAARLAEELRADSQRREQAGTQAVIDTVLRLASERLGAQSAASTHELEAKKGLIDQQLHSMSAELGRVTGLVKQLEQDRAEKFGQLSAQIAAAGQQTVQLSETTRQLREALASTKVRGQWGERMAEDVLRLAGFVENVNYRKQKAVQGTGRIPDFTFLLPRDLRLHMDVKFPLDNYVRYLECDRDSDRERCRTAFLRDVRQRVKELTTREYVDPEGGTVDCVLLFIPNEQLYAFIHEQDASIPEEALRHKVVFCSPLTLFAVLAVVRQSVDNFMLERRSDEILTLLGGFSQQWGKFVEQMDKVGTHLDRAQRAYGDLVTTRRRQLERPLDRLEDLRRQSELPEGGEPAAELVVDASLPRAS